MSAADMTDLPLARQLLTPAEYAAYELAAKGMSQRSIALALHISRSAVRARLENAQRKFDLHQRQSEEAA